MVPLGFRFCTQFRHSSICFCCLALVCMVLGSRVPPKPQEHYIWCPWGLRFLHIILSFIRNNRVYDIAHQSLVANTVVSSLFRSVFLGKVWLANVHHIDYSNGNLVVIDVTNNLT